MNLYIYDALQIVPFQHNEGESEMYWKINFVDFNKQIYIIYILLIKFNEIYEFAVF